MPRDPTSRALHPVRGPGPRRRQRVAGVLLVGAALANCAFLLGPLIGVARDPMHSFVSGLSALGSPHAAVFRTADLVTGSLLLAGALVGWPCAPGTPWLRLARWALLLFAVGTVADGLLPMDCDPGGQAACRAAEQAGAVSWHHQAHSVIGVLSSAATIAATLGLGLGTRPAPGWGRRSRLWLGAAGLLLAGSTAISVQYLLALPGVGVSQRLMILVWAGALALAGWVLLRVDWPWPLPPRWPTPDPADVRTVAVALPDQPGTVLRVEVHHRHAPRVALVSGGLGLPLELWHPVAAALPDVCLVLVDRPGLGGSTPWATPPSGLAGQVAVLDAALDAALEAADRPRNCAVVVVGHSYGGLLAETYARQRPHRVAALVLVDPSDPTPEAAHPIRANALVRLARRALVHDRWARPVGRVVGWAITAFGTARLDARIPPWQGPAGLWTSRHVRASLLELQLIGPESAELLDLSAGPARVGRPTQLLIANRGGWPLYRTNRRWIEQITARGALLGAQATTVDGAHLLMLDDPAAVAGAIRRASQSETWG